MKDSFNLYAELAFLWFENLHRQEGVCLIDVHLLCGTCPVGFQCCHNLAIWENLQKLNSLFTFRNWQHCNIRDLPIPLLQYKYWLVKIFHTLNKKVKFWKKDKTKSLAAFQFLTNDFFHFSCQCFWTKTKYILVFCWEILTAGSRSYYLKRASLEWLFCCFLNCKILILVTKRHVNTFCNLQ